MIKTTVTPQNTDLHILIPEGYVGKPIEVILYSVEEASPVVKHTNKKRKPSDFAGTLSKKEAKAFTTHIEQTRNEWERDI